MTHDEEVALRARSVAGAAIDALRELGKHEVADAIQFGREGVDRHDGHRCRLCEQLAGGDRGHRCWGQRPAKVACNYDQCSLDVIAYVRGQARMMAAEESTFGSGSRVANRIADDIQNGKHFGVAMPEDPPQKAILGLDKDSRHRELGYEQCTHDTIAFLRAMDESDIDFGVGLVAKFEAGRHVGAASKYAYRHPSSMPAAAAAPETEHERGYKACSRDAAAYFRSLDRDDDIGSSLAKAIESNDHVGAEPLEKSLRRYVSDFKADYERGYVACTRDIVAFLLDLDGDSELAEHFEDNRHLGAADAEAKR